MISRKVKVEIVWMLLRVNINVWLLLQLYTTVVNACKSPALDRLFVLSKYVGMVPELVCGFLFVNPIEFSEF